MNALARKWIEALRSGHFRQARMKLQGEGESYCCLGVACVVAESEGIPVYRGLENRISGTDLGSNQPQVLQALRLTRDGQNKCIGMNDDNNLSFTEIANQLELYPSLYFVQEGDIQS